MGHLGAGRATTMPTFLIKSSIGGYLSAGRQSAADIDEIGANSR